MKKKFRLFTSERFKKFWISPPFTVAKLAFRWLSLPLKMLYNTKNKS